VASTRESFAVLRHRDVRLLLGAAVVSLFGDRMMVVALPFAVLEVGGSATAIGVVLAAQAIALMLGSLVGGVLGDRLSRRGVMFVSDVVRVASQAAMAALLIAGVAEVWSLALLAGVLGAGTGVFYPAVIGLIPELVPEDELQQANALRGTAMGLAEIAGPALGGLLIAAVGAGWAVAVDAATFAVSAACLAALRLAPHVRDAVPASFLTDLRAGWSAFRSRRWVWSVVAYFAVANTFWAAWSTLGPVVAERELGGADVWGLVVGATGLGALAGTFVAVRIDPARPLVVVALCEGLFALPLAFLAAGAPPVVLGVGTFLCGIGLMLGITTWESTLQREVPADVLSRVISFDAFASFAITPVGRLLWGPVAGVLGLAGALWAAFGLMIASAATLLSLRDVRGLRRDARRERDLVADDPV
jgi:MFS family permease